MMGSESRSKGFVLARRASSTSKLAGRQIWPLPSPQLGPRESQRGRSMHPSCRWCRVLPGVSATAARGTRETGTKTQRGAARACLLPLLLLLAAAACTASVRSTTAPHTAASLDCRPAAKRGSPCFLPSLTEIVQMPSQAFWVSPVRRAAAQLACGSCDVLCRRRAKPCI